MSSHSNPKWFKPIVIIALLWNLIGVINFFIQINLSEEAIAALPEAEQALMNSTPLWSLVAFALGVFGGTIGSLGLLMQKKWAFYPLLFSLVGVVAQMTYWLFFTQAVDVYGSETYTMPVLVILVAFFLLRLAKKGIKEGYLN